MSLVTLKLIDQLRAGHATLLTGQGASALRAFLAGYRYCNSSVGCVVDKLANLFDGPRSLDACTRAYLTVEDNVAAFHLILDRMQDVVASEPEVIPAATSSETLKSPVHTLQKVMKEGRSGLILSEPTVLYLADYMSGYVEGAASIDNDAAHAMKCEIGAFEEWLSKRYFCPRQTRWYKIIRVYEGVDMDGVRAFLDMWDRFDQEGR